MNELEQLKDQADSLSIPYHTNIGVVKLKEKIDEVLSKKTAVSGKKSGIQEYTTDVIEKAFKPETVAEKNARLRRESNRLVRVLITCMDPSKSKWKGEIFSVGNSVIGTIKKFVPYNTESTDGYHIPYILYKELKERKFPQRIKITQPNGKTRITTKLANAFNIVLLDPLTSVELKELAERQALNHSID